MSKWKRMAVSAILIMLVVWSLWGCGSSPEMSAKELNIMEPENHLASWRKELPQDGEYTAWDVGAARGLEIQKDGETVFAVSYEPRAGKESFDYWDISEPYQSTVSVNTEELYRLLDTVFQINWEKTEGISLEDAGIAGSKTSIFIAYNREQNAGEKGGEEPTGTRTILIGEKDGQGNYYAALDGGNEVVRVNQVLMDDILNIDPYQYILKLPVLVSVDTVETVRILSDGEHHEMEKKDDSWRLDGKEVDQGEFQSLYGKLLDIMVLKEIEDDDADSKNAARKPVLTLQFIRNVKEASDIEVKYFEYDEQFMSVSVNGHEYFLVEKSSVYNLMEDIEVFF